MEKGDIDIANDATGAMAKDAKSSNASCSRYSIFRQA